LSDPFSDHMILKRITTAAAPPNPSPMPLPDLETLLGTRTKVRLLRALLPLDDPVSGREARRLAGAPSSSAALSALADLTESGIVLREEVGGTHLYRANREHVFWEPLARLFEAEAGVETAAARLVEEELQRSDCPPPLAVIVVAPARGVAASSDHGDGARRRGGPSARPRGDAAPGAAPDLLVVAEDEAEAERLRLAIPGVLGRVGQRLGDLGGATICSLASLARRVASRDAHVARLLGGEAELETAAERTGRSLQETLRERITGTRTS
jgi:hypothetical protein